MDRQYDFSDLKKLMVQGRIDGNDLIRRYEIFSSIDDEALIHLRRRIGEEASPHLVSRTTERTLWRPLYAVAVAVALLIVGGLYWWWQEARVVPPEISEAVQTAMIQSQQAGRQEAIVEKISCNSFSNSIAKTLEKEGREDVRHGQRPKKSLQTSSTEGQYATDLGTGTESGETVERMLAAKRVTTKSDKEYWLTLPDGSLVHLNYNTRVIYPEQFEGPTRDVILEGEAYFMVAKDKRHPFIVHTRQGAIKVYGTEFNVASYSLSHDVQSSAQERETVDVVLVKGSVGVKPAGGKEQMMRPSQKCSMFNGQWSMEDVDVTPYVAWNTGQFVFREQSLQKIMEVMARWYGYEVVCEDDGLSDIILSGNFDRYDNIKATLESLEVVTGLSFDVKRDKIVIYNPNLKNNSL